MVNSKRQTSNSHPSEKSGATKARTTLDAFLQQEGMSSVYFAAALRAVRRHPTIPSAAQVGHWRRGARRPTHDMRVFIEVLTHGRVSVDDDYKEKPPRS